MCDHSTPKCDLNKIQACDDRTAKQNMAYVGACGHSRSGLLYLGTTAGCSAIYKPRLGQRCPMVVKMLNIVNVPTRLCSLALTLEKKYSKQYFLRVGEF